MSSIVQKYVGEGLFSFASYYSARYRRFVMASLLNEGGVANDPDDMGGKTVLGIASRYWPEEYQICMNYWKTGQYSLAIEYSIQFYHKNFYSYYYDKIVDESLAFKIFDFGINASPKAAIRILQDTVNGWQKYKSLKDDGVMGALTLGAINSITRICLENDRVVEGETVLYRFYILNVKEYYKTRSTFGKFGKGWLKRLFKTFNLKKGKVTWARYKANTLQ